MFDEKLIKNSLEKSFFNEMFFNNSILDYIIFFIIITCGIIIIFIIKSKLIKWLVEKTEKTTTQLDDFLVNLFKEKIIILLYFTVLYLALKTLILPPIIVKIINTTGIIVFSIIGILFLSHLIEYIIKKHWLEKLDESKSKSFKGLFPAVKVIFWGIGIVFILDNLGFEISAVVAGLGIGGIAVAMASQAVLKDLFSYFAILFDRPFEIGDFIIINEYMGEIENIGLKTTKIRSLSGELLIFSNSDLTSSRLKNYKKMEKRRVVFTLKVTYQTSFLLVKEIPEIIKSIIDSISETTFDRAHFFSYGDSSLDFEVVYYVLSADYNIYMDIQQKINLSIMEEFEKQGIEFAYPTRTLYLNQKVNN